MSTNLEKMVKEYSKKYKDTMVVVPGSDENVKREIDVISTGSLLLNDALGIGGYPRGRLTEIFGKNATGKTTLALHAIAEAQKEGLWALYLDFEHALDIQYMERLGIDLENILIIQADSGEDGFEIAEDILNTKSDNLGVIVVDSIAAINTRQEKGSGIGDQHIGLTARLINKIDRKFIPLIVRKNVSLIFINQLRANISGYGLSETTTGGKSIPYYASVRMRVNPAGYVEKNGEKIGIKSRVDIRKNKLSTPYKRAEIQILFGQGLDRANEVVNYLVDQGQIIRAGSWYKLDDDTTLGQGAENTYQENQELLEQMIRELHNEE